VALGLVGAGSVAWRWRSDRRPARSDARPSCRFTWRGVSRLRRRRPRPDAGAPSWSRTKSFSHSSPRLSTGPFRGRVPRRSRCMFGTRARRCRRGLQLFPHRRSRSPARRLLRRRRHDERRRQLRTGTRRRLIRRRQRAAAVRR
jgi:hypothetical protein